MISQKTKALLKIKSKEKLLIHNPTVLEKTRPLQH
jgi:hypothetical protein